MRLLGGSTSSGLSGSRAWGFGSSGLRDFRVLGLGFGVAGLQGGSRGRLQLSTGNP